MLIEEQKNYPKWVDNFITYNEETDEYIAWDEVQCNEIGKGNSRDEMVDCVLKYAEWLENEGKEEFIESILTESLKCLD